MEYVDKDGTKIPISENEIDYAYSLKDRLEKENIRVEIDISNEKIGYKIRQAQMEKVPYMFVLGKNEIENNTISLRARNGNKEDNVSIEKIIQMLNDEIKSSLDK